MQQKVYLKLIPVILLLGSEVVLQAQVQPALTVPVVSDRPLKEVADRLRHLRAKVVTYEDPIWVWPGELEPLAKNQVGKLLTPRQVAVALPANLLSEPDVSVVLDRMMTAYHSQTTGPRFRVLMSRLGLHIIPTQVHDENGMMVIARNPLDVPIFVPAGDRLPSEHMKALLDSVSASTGLPFELVTAVAVMGQHAGDPLDELFDLDARRFNWGISQQTAREALVDLLSQSETSFSWVLNYVPGKKSTDGKAYLNIVPLEVTVSDPDGKLVNKGIFYDRCKKCPPLYPVPISPAR